MRAQEIGGSNAAHGASGHAPGAAVSSQQLAPAGDQTQPGSFAEGYAAGQAAATREMLVRLNELRVALIAAPLGAAALLGNASGVGSVPALDTNRAGR